MSKIENRAILIDVSAAGLAILCRWDLKSLCRLTRFYSANIVHPLILVDFDTGITFRAWISADDTMKIREVEKDVTESDKND